MKKAILITLVLVAVGVGAGVYTFRRNQPEPEVRTMALSRGDVVDAVQATGTLEAVETVDVGTQVSGVVQALHADFNDIVKKGQIIARLDPQLIETQIEQQTANVVRAEADLERLRVNLADSRQKLQRAKELSERSLIPRQELETAEVNVKSAEAQIRSSEAGLTQARAQLNNQKVNLSYTTIYAPIDGIVISRNVDQGQTVAASMNAPTLYVIAADLTKMQVLANIDEADVGRMRPGQHVTFRVDAYPYDTFTGAVQQVRLLPAVVQNVVTYSTVIAVPNNDLKLKPGMTANVSIEVARRNNVLRAPSAAFRFRPTNEMFAALNQEVPPEMQRGPGGRGQFGAGGPGGGGFGNRGEGPGGSAPAAQPEGTPAPTAGAAPTAPPQASAPGGRPSATAPPNGPRQGAEARGGGDQFRAGSDQTGENRRGGGRGGFDPNMSPEERQRRMEERLKNMSPEERQRWEARMRERGAEGGGGRGGFPGAGGSRSGGVRGEGGNRQAGTAGGQPDARGGANATTPQTRTFASGATTIDALFAPLPVREGREMAWLYVDKKLKPVRLRTGISDGTWTEVLNESELPPNTELVISMTTGLETRTTPGQGGGQNPLMGPQRGGGDRGRGPGGGGGGRGR
jgi:HlyD family secretion protein